MSFAARLSSVRMLVGCVSVINGVIEGEGVWRRGGLSNELRRSLELCDRQGVLIVCVRVRKGVIEREGVC